MRSEKDRWRKVSTGSIGLLALCLLTSGCASSKADLKTGLYAKPIGNAPATVNPTQYSASLICLAQTAAGTGRSAPRVAVGAISDLTGKRDFDTGAKISQGASLFAVTALGRAGVRLVERSDLTISDVELAYAKAHTLSDTPEKAGSDAQNFRPVHVGQIAGSDYYIVGGITELNYNIKSSGIEARGGDVGTAGFKGSLNASSYVINIAIDLRMIDSKSQEIVDITSYQKQIIGREIKPGVFDFLNGNVFDISGGKSELEPMQLAARTLVERSIYDFASGLYDLNPASCLKTERVRDKTAVGAKAVIARADPPLAPAPPARKTAMPPPQQPAVARYNGPYLDKSKWMAPW